MCKNCVRSGGCSGNCQCKQQHPEYDWQFDDDRFFESTTLSKPEIVRR